METKKEGSKIQVMAEILPKNDISAAIIKKREELEAARRDRETAQRVQQEMADKERRNKAERNKLDRENKEKMALLNAKREAEEQEESKKLTGRMLAFLKKAKLDETPKDFSLSGLDLGPARTSILAKVVCFNSSLTTLHMARKNIGDAEGAELARMLLTNTTLRKLELEGNSLGKKSAKGFGAALRVNKTLRFLDLESNNLTQDDGEDIGGITVFVQALKENRHLLSLNLANNKLNETLGKEFRDMLKVNTTLIDFEFGFNKFHLDQIRQIQKLLLRNNEKYREDRLREWRERKMMADEDENLAALYLKQGTADEQLKMEEETKETREREIDQQWQKYKTEMEEEKKNTILQLMEAAEIRGTRGKKGRKGKGKGKKKK